MNAKPRERNGISLMYSRLLKGVGANSYGQAINILVQIISVPILLHYLGFEGYGEWLILSTLPAYLAMSDFGIASVAANKMVFSAAQNKQRDVIVIFRSLFGFIIIISLVVIILLTSLLYFLDVRELLGLSILSADEVLFILIMLCAQVLVSMQVNVLSAAYRSKNRYAEGMFWVHSSRLLEWILAVFLMWLQSGILAFAAGLALGRMVGYFFMYFRLKKIDIRFTLGINGANISIIKEMIRPGFGFMAFPLGLAVILQGMTLVVGNVLGAAAVAQFNILRTASRLLVQGVTIINHAIWPEISYAYGEKNILLLKRLLVSSVRYSFCSGFAGVVLISLTHLWIFEIWIGNDFNVDSLQFFLLLIVALLSIIGQPTWVFLMATNKHSKFSFIYILLAFLSVFLSWHFMGLYGVNGGIFFLILFEVFVIFYSAVHVSRVVGINLKEYICLAFFWVKCND